MNTIQKQLVAAPWVVSASLLFVVLTGGGCSRQPGDGLAGVKATRVGDRMTNAQIEDAIRDLDDMLVVTVGPGRPDFASQVAERDALFERLLKQGARAGRLLSQSVRSGLSDRNFRRYWTTRLLRFEGLDFTWFVAACMERGIPDDEWTVIVRSAVPHREEWAYSLALSMAASANANIRKNCVQILWKWSRPEVEDVLLRAFVDADPEVRLTAARSALQPAFDGSRAFLESLIRAVGDSDEAVAITAHDVLKHIIDRAAAPKWRVVAEPWTQTSDDIRRDVYDQMLEWGPWLAQNGARLKWDAIQHRFVVP